MSTLYCILSYCRGLVSSSVVPVWQHHYHYLLPFDRTRL